MPLRVSFVIDGLNLYYSLRLLHEMTGGSVKWLDLQKLCADNLQVVRSATGERAELATIHYFSAVADFLGATRPDTIQRHLVYLDALRSAGIAITLSRFQRKTLSCPSCGQSFERHEEKETDVGVAVKLIEVFATDECDAVVVVTGDTDLIPAIRTARGLFPDRPVGVGFPFLRYNTDIARYAGFHFKFGQRDIQRAQFPPELTLADGRTLRKPPGW